MQYLLLFSRPAANQTGSARYLDGVIPPIPAIGQTAEFLVDGTADTVAAGSVTGISYNYQDTTGAEVVVTITVGP
jgi:hypothetical protein